MGAGAVHGARVLQLLLITPRNIRLKLERGWPSRGLVDGLDTGWDTETGQGPFHQYQSARD